MIPYKLIIVLPLRSARYPKKGATHNFTKISNPITKAFLKFYTWSFLSISNFCWRSIGCNESTLTKINESIK